MLVVGRGEEGGVLEETNDSEELIARVAALDIGKAELVCCNGCLARAKGADGCRRCGPTRP
jgi:hypothetical protein